MWFLTLTIFSVASSGECCRGQRSSSLGSRGHPDGSRCPRPGQRHEGLQPGGGPGPGVRDVPPGLLLHSQRGQTLRVSLRHGARDRPQVSRNITATKFYSLHSWLV